MTDEKLKNEQYYAFEQLKCLVIKLIMCLVIYA